MSYYILIKHKNKKKIENLITEIYQRTKTIDEVWGVNHKQTSTV